MNETDPMKKMEVKKRIRQLVTHQRFAVIATETKKQPYTNLVAFATTPDLRSILFATKRGTQKYLNIHENNRIAVLIDNRENTPADLSNAMTVTALGIAHEAQDKNEDYLTFLVQKHPDLSSFLHNPDCAIIKIQVKTYQLIHKFEQVQILHIRDVEG
jgi:general stress protein 26